MNFAWLSAGDEDSEYRIVIKYIREYRDQSILIFAIAFSWSRLL